ncbi:hypothetical protein Q0N12_15900 [Rossellomorea marisflavi]|uniref:hypothetical protein n=1 Tax=Rossellomorea marisflavi TaxID=189381 RepID=UPI00204099DB|nr:hypothetical protein [Rossellomorea marisflavi]MCM2589587.1 hypothetical protein [Rossellomorea marisflavi]
MKKQRYVLCLLMTGVLLYYAVPRLSIFAEGLEGWFSLSWLILAMFVLAGNFAAVLYSPKKGKKGTKQPERKRVLGR